MSETNDNNEKILAKLVDGVENLSRKVKELETEVLELKERIDDLENNSEY